MITVFNAQNYAQQWFFDKAFAILKAKGLLNEQELRYERFLGLDGYFAHIDELVKIEPSYVLIPSDEEPFAIDANTRTISIPAAFNKCTGVVGDDMCEIITFTVDRYFDYVDLATTKICIQWEANGKEGISHIGLIDYGSIPGKLRFGWPLTKELTATSGPVKFAVRFFMKNKEDKFVYVLNTLTATITIKDGLNIKDPLVEEEDVYSLFGQFVQKSTNPTYPTPAPVYFDNNVGINLPDRNKVDENDMMEFKAQAIVSDNGYIKYQWYFKEGATPDQKDAKYIRAEQWDGEAKYYKLDAAKNEYVRAYPNNEEEFKKDVYYVYVVLTGMPITNLDPRFEIEEKYVEIVTPEKRNGSEQYFKQVETGVFKLILDPELPRDIQLYEKITTLRVKTTEEIEAAGEDPKAITGLYWVGAQNYVGDDSFLLEDENGLEVGKIYAINHTPELNSKYCYVGTPENIGITKNLNEDLFMEVQKDNSLKAELELGLSKDAGDPTRTFTWYYSPDEKSMSDSEVVAIGVNKDKLEVANAGWYYAHVESKLNRATTETVSNVCRVVEHAKAPQLLKMEYAKWDLEAKLDPDTYFSNPLVWTTIYDIEDPDLDVNMESGVATIKGEIIRLRITTDLDNTKLDGEGLQSDKLDYRWYVIEPDNEARELSYEDIDESKNKLIPYDKDVAYKGLGSNVIDIVCQVNDVKYFFFCQVDNTLVGEKKSLEQTDYPKTFVIW